MTARTSSGSGLFSAVVGTCVNGDTFTIQSGHNVTLDVDLSGLTTGLGASTINGVMDCKADVATGLFMNGNLDVNGALYIANRAVVSGFTLTDGKSNVYEVARTLKVATVEETLGNGYKDVVDDLTDLAVGIENSRLRGLDEPEMMADVVKEFRISYRDSLTLADALNYLENNSSRFYHDQTNNKLYIHTSDSSNPSTKTITVIEPINRPTSGTESRCNIKFNATGVISNTGGGTPIIRNYAWYPSREWTQLDANAALNATTIVLKEDLGLQAGDKILIGTDAENIYLTESQAGTYTVQSYNSGTKTVTLTAGIGTARFANDYVAIFSRPIKISRSSGTLGIVEVNTINNIVLQGVSFAIRFLNNNQYYSPFPTGYRVSHCSSGAGASAAILACAEAPIVSDCVARAGSLIINCSNAKVSNSIGINNLASQPLVGSNRNNVKVENCITQNTGLIGQGAVYKNCIFKNNDYIAQTDTSIFKNCTFSKITDNQNYSNLKVHTFYDCIFGESSTGWLKNITGELYNCLFNSSVEINPFTAKFAPAEKIESFDHNQTPGNYKAWMRGGRIITEDNKLKFICETNDYPVFKDYPILAPANRSIKFQVNALKNFNGGTVKLQIIDPSNDPLIDSTAIPLAEKSLVDVKDELNRIEVRYRPTTSKQLIFRILCQNSTGNVIISNILYTDMFRRKKL